MMNGPVRQTAFVVIASLGLLMIEAEAGATRKIRVIIDADTANEIDDFYAIVRGLLAPEFQVEGLCSATFGRNPPTRNIRASQQFNEEILAHLGLSGAIPAPMGSATPMPDKRTPADSPAARHIIKCAHAGGSSAGSGVMTTGHDVTSRTRAASSGVLTNRLMSSLLSCRSDRSPGTRHSSSCSHEMRPD